MNTSDTDSDPTPSGRILFWCAAQNHHGMVDVIIATRVNPLSLAESEGN